MATRTIWSCGEYLLKSAPKFHIEYGVNYRINATVDVTQPGGYQVDHHAGSTVNIELYTDTIDDVTGKEWRPADEEYPKHNG